MQRKKKLVIEVYYLISVNLEAYNFFLQILSFSEYEIFTPTENKSKKTRKTFEIHDEASGI